MTAFRYHGMERQKATEDLADYHVVITTYNTLASEYKKKKSILHRIGWYRIVLDEGVPPRSHVRPARVQMLTSAAQLTTFEITRPYSTMLVASWRPILGGV